MARYGTIFSYCIPCRRVAWQAMAGGLLFGALVSLSAKANGADIFLPVDVSAVVGEIAVEIDGSDMTDFVRIDDGQLVVSASAALVPGPHEAIIYVLTGGEYRVFAIYSFDVAESADPRVSVALTAEHEAGVTAVNGAAEGHIASSGTLVVETVDHSMTARLTYGIDSRDEHQIAGRFANIAQYSIELRQSGPLLDLVGRIGHQSLGFDRALVGDLNRRGLSVEGAGPGERLQFHLFALKSSGALGVDNVLGLSVEEDRMFGGRLAFRPFVGSDFRVSVQAYEGRGMPDFVFAGAGSGHGLAFDGSLLDGRLRYDLSLARARWDGDGAGPLPEDIADAVLGALAYDLEPANGASLTLGLEYERIDFFYFSLANPGLPGNGGETLRLTSDYAADRLTLYGTVETTLTNVGGDPADPIDRVNMLALEGSWALYEAGFLSDATLTFRITNETIRRVETPLLALGPEDWDATTASVGLEKFGETAGWSLLYTYLREDDDGPGNFDLRGHELQATLDLAPSDRLTLSASALAGRYDSAFSGQFERFDGDIGLTYELDPGLWALRLDLGLATTTELGIEDGAYVAAQLSRSFANGAELVATAGWYDGSYAAVSGLEEEKILGLTYRLRSDVFQ